MLFNSFQFILLFLPLTLAGFFWIGARSPKWAASWLALASFFFYGWWNPVYVGLLLGSILFNYGMGMAIGNARQASQLHRARQLATLAIAGDLGLLAYYKYANFFVSSANSLSGSDFHLGTIMLPLGISFFTFTQIAYLVDTLRGQVREVSFIHYTLFVTYFPHLIAGPVLHHKEMMPQFADPANYRPHAEDFAIGLTIFAIGLFKKAVLADGIAPSVGPLFLAAQAGASPSLLDAWGGALAYTLQLYFDFSGYSDMAIGLSRLFGVRLPLNFNSPYKAADIGEFWRRWHMTLSRFLRDYLYIPLGGNRHGPARRHVNLMTTMLLGGLWHGAGWTFVIWGGLHGLYLVIHQLWRELMARMGYTSPGQLYRFAARALTFLAVVVGWVYFRAADLSGAARIISAMAGLNGISLPSALQSPLGPLAPWLVSHGVRFELGGGSRFINTWMWVISLLGLVFFLPNTQEIMRNAQPALDIFTLPRPGGWRPSRRWALVSGGLLGLGLLSLTHVSEFLYFQF